MSLLTRAEHALSSHFEQAAGVGEPTRATATLSAVGARPLVSDTA